jgi:hypothetical protein
MVNGYSPVVSRRYVDEVYWPLDHLNRGEVTEREYERLRALDVRFLVVDRGAFPPQVNPFGVGFTLNRLRASPYVDLLMEHSPLWLFAVRQTPLAGRSAMPTTPHGLFLEAERLPRRTGTVVEDPEASWGRAVRVGGGDGAREPAYLLVGARVGLPRGSFRLIFRLSGGAPGDRPVARLEVAADGGRRLLASRLVAGSALSRHWGDHLLEFALERPEWVEIRVRWEGHGDLGLDYVYGTFADQEDPPRLFRNDDFAFGHGPYRRFPPGVYELRFHSRVDARLDRPVLGFTVATAHERRPLASRVVRGTELSRAGVYEDVTLPLTVERLSVLEILIDFLVKGLSVDQITVVRRS